MAVSRRRKSTIILLAVYWPTFFIASHIPVPGLVREAGVSDKALHFLAYLTLAFLFWVTLSPESKVNWRKAAVWWAILTMVVYAIIDELLQGCVGRSCDIRDLAADLAGILAGFVLLTIFSFPLVAVVVAGSIIFGLTNLARANLSELVPVVNAVFHLFGYAVFTLLWIGCMQRFCLFTGSKHKWLAAASGLPAALLLSAKACSFALGREFPALDVILALAAIVGAVGAIHIVTSSHQSGTHGAVPPDG